MKGVAGCSVGDITERAAIAKGSFYLHFESKEAVLAALRDQFVDGILSEIGVSVAACATGDWNARLETWVRSALRTCMTPENLALNEVLFHGQGSVSLGEDQASHRRGIEALRELVAGGVAGGAWSAPNPRMTAVFVYFAFHGALDDAATRGEGDAERLADELLRLCRRLLRPD